MASIQLLSSFSHLPKLRIEILECDGGAGHKTCANAIRTVLEKHFQNQGREIEIVQTDVGCHLVPDPLIKLTFGKYKAVDLHDCLAKKGYTRIIKLNMKIASFIHRFYFNAQINYFNRHLNSGNQRPDLVISAVPLVNSALVTSAKNWGIPVLITTTDADNALFSINWPNDKQLPPHRYGIPYNSYEIAKKVHCAVDPANIRGIGYPLRPEFLKSYSEQEKLDLKQKLGISSTHQHIGIMMGGLGGEVIEKYFKQIINGHQQDQIASKKAHFTFFCGKNKEIVSALAFQAEQAGFKKDESYLGEGSKFVHPSSGLAFTLLGFTKNVHEYMAVSHLWITKPGSSSFNECLAMGVPMLIDNTTKPLPWEALNIELAETYHFGEKVTKFKDFNPVLNKMLELDHNMTYQQAIKQYRDDRPVQRDFTKNIVHLTEELLKEAAAAEKTTSTTSQVINLSTKEKVKNICSCMLSMALKVSKMVGRFLGTIFVEPLKFIGRKIVQYACFSGFYMNEKQKKQRRKELIQGIRRNKKGGIKISPHKAHPIEGSEKPITSPISNRAIDALYIKSASENRTGNAIIYVLGKSYQGFNPKNYDHLLDAGADVILFNPSDLSVKAMEADLKRLIQELKQRNPQQKLAMQGYCIGAHVAGSVVSDIAAGKVDGVNPEAIPAIIDRGFGDGYEVASKSKFLSLIAKISYFKNFINEYYNARTLDKIHRHQGDMLFLSPKDGHDQLLHKKIKGKIQNFTKELYERHGKTHSQWIELPGGHWTPWSIDVNNQITSFLAQKGLCQRGPCPL